MHRRTFGESADKLIEEFLCAYLELEGVSAILDTYVQELSKGELCEVQGGAVWAYIEREEGNVLIAVVDVVHDGNSCFSRPGTSLASSV